MKVFSYIMNTVLVVIVLAVGGLFALPYLPIEQTIDVRIVESGSMEPSIMTGAMTVVRPVSSYAVGDVIMFENRYQAVPTTHRIIDSYEENGQTWFVTQGDANEDPDSDPVMLQHVLGKVVLDVPRVGFVLDYARQPLGFMLLVVLPAALLILSELEKIWQELRRRRPHEDNDVATPPPAAPAATLSERVSPKTQPSRVGQMRMMDIATPAHWPSDGLARPVERVVAHTRPSVRPQQSLFGTASIGGTLVLVALVIAAQIPGSTLSYFTDTERSVANQLVTIALDVSVVADGSTFSFVDGALVDDDGGATFFITPVGESVNTIYSVATAVVGTTTPLCGALAADAAAPLSYNGQLTALSGNLVTIDVPWFVGFTLSTTTGFADGEECSVAFTVTAWEHSVPSEFGYYDEETVTLEFTYVAPLVQNAFAPAGRFSSFAVPTPQTQGVDGGIENAPGTALPTPAASQSPALNEQFAAENEDGIDQSNEQSDENKDDTGADSTEHELGADKDDDGGDGTDGLDVSNETGDDTSEASGDAGAGEAASAEEAIGEESTDGDPTNEVDEARDVTADEHEENDEDVDTEDAEEQESADAVAAESAAEALSQTTPAIE